MPTSPDPTPTNEQAETSPVVPDSPIVTTGNVATALSPVERAVAAAQIEMAEAAARYQS